MVVAALALALILVPLKAFEPAPTPAPTPLPGITPSAGRIFIVPGVDGRTERALRADLTAFFNTLYEAAFVAKPSTDPIPSPAPTPTPTVAPGVRSIERFFTAQARATLRANPGVFEAPDVVVRQGEVGFKGVTTFHKNKARSALFNVYFTARASGRSGTTVLLRQRGSVQLLRDGDRWLVNGFNLRLNADTEPTPPPVVSGRPSPTPRER